MRFVTFQLSEGVNHLCTRIAGSASNLLGFRTNIRISEIRSAFPGKLELAIGKLAGAGRGLWLQANTEYPDRDTELALTCDRKPEWRIEPAAAAKTARGDETTRTLNLRLAHRDGAVEVELK